MPKKAKVTAADCQSCGACCVGDYWGEAFVDLTTRDYGRLSKYYQRKVLWDDTLEGMSFPQMPVACTGGVTRCTALRGTLMQHVSCAIYENRPAACRNFKPGCRECLDSRRQLERE